MQCAVCDYAIQANEECQTCSRCMTTCHAEPCAEALEFKGSTCKLCIPHIREGQLAVFTQWGFVPLWTPHESPSKRKSTAPATSTEAAKKPKTAKTVDLDLQCHEVLPKVVDLQVDLQCHEVLPDLAMPSSVPEFSEVLPRVVSRDDTMACDVSSSMCKMPRLQMKEDVMCPPPLHGICQEDIDMVEFSIEDWMGMLSNTSDSLCVGVELAIREMIVLLA
jgi:hypothetical protein